MNRLMCVLASPWEVIESVWKAATDRVLRPRLPALLMALCLGALLCPAAAAHDFWMEIDPPLRSAPGKATVKLFTGASFQGDSMPRIDDWFTRFTVTRPGGNSMLVNGVIGDDPAGTFETDADGTYAVVYVSTSAYAELDAARFNRYLRDEDLAHIERLRVGRGESNAVAREVYYRYAKSLMVQGEATPLRDSRMGLELELVALPRTDGVSDARSFELMFRGAPLPGVRVQLWRKGSESDALEARTDSAGQVTLSMPAQGYYLLKAVHAIEAPPDSGLTQWLSFWASLTFEHRAKN